MKTDEFIKLLENYSSLQYQKDAAICKVARLLTRHQSKDKLCMHMAYFLWKLVDFHDEEFDDLRLEKAVTDLDEYFAKKYPLS